MSPRNNQGKQLCNLLPTLNFIYAFYVSTQAFVSKLEIKQQKKKELYVGKNVMTNTSFELVFNDHS